MSEEGGEAWGITASKAVTAGRWGARVKCFRRKMSISFHVDADHASSSASRRRSGSRGAVTSWTRGMSRSIRHKIDNHREDFRVFATLTYPATAPTTGKAIKAHWRALVERARRVGLMEKGTWVWWLEFQERGAPHFHFLSTTWVAKAWLAKAWAQVTGGNEHVATRVEGLRHPERAGGYAAKYAAKMEQKQIPSGFLDVGRMWGMVGKARKFREGPGGPTPYREAALPRSEPGRVAWEISRRWGVRMYENPIGWTIYAGEKVLKGVWRWLMERLNLRSRINVTWSATTTLKDDLSGLPMLAG